MKHIVSVDIQKKDESYGFCLTFDKKRLTFKVRSLSEGFKKVMELVQEKNEVQTTHQTQVPCETDNM